MKKFLCVFIAVVFLSACSVPSQEFAPDGLLSSCYLDVGQGDSEVIIFPDGRVMLIDAGIKEAFVSVDGFFKERNITRIDWLVATHPHSDHIGGMADVIENYEIGEIYMPKITHTTKTYTNLLEAIDKKELTVHTAKSGVKIIDEPGLSAEILSPSRDDYEDINSHSAVIRIVYGTTAFLYMGDAGFEVEEELSGDISADVLKVGHHGSQYSGSDDFLERVHPRFAVISAGKDNDYGHPSKKAVKRLRNAGAEILVTMDSGNIIMKSDGKEVWYQQ